MEQELNLLGNMIFDAKISPSLAVLIIQTEFPYLRDKKQVIDSCIKCLETEKKRMEQEEHE